MKGLSDRVVGKDIVPWYTAASRGMRAARGLVSHVFVFSVSVLAHVYCRPSFSLNRYGRVNFVLGKRLELLKEVQRLQVKVQLNPFSPRELKVHSLNRK